MMLIIRRRSSAVYCGNSERARTREQVLSVRSSHGFGQCAGRHPKSPNAVGDPTGRWLLSKVTIDKGFVEQQERTEPVWVFLWRMLVACDSWLPMQTLLRKARVPATVSECLLNVVYVLLSSPGQQFRQAMCESLIRRNPPSPVASDVPSRKLKRPAIPVQNLPEHGRTMSE